jgi:hypothetical protein
MTHQASIRARSWLITPATAGRSRKCGKSFVGQQAVADQQAFAKTPLASNSIAANRT